MKSMNRRELFRNGGIALSMGALIAACGENRGGGTDPGRLGLADPAPELPSLDPDDAMLLRTLQSVEHTLVAVYAQIAAAGGLQGTPSGLTDRFVADHAAHAAEFGALAVAAGGEEFPCANPFALERAVEPAFAATAGTDDLDRDLINIALAFEDWAARSCQALITEVSDPSLRPELMTAASASQRRGAGLAHIATDDELLSPLLVGKPVLPDENGFPIAYAIPATFGQLTAVPLVIGPRNDEGTRYTYSLQTPAANTFVPPDATCE